MLVSPLPEALTFDDVLLVPAHSDVVPTQVSTSTRLTARITLNTPLLSAAMDTVTESRLAIAMAQAGGMGVVHRNLTIEQQASEIDKVKRSESGMIVDPVTISPDQPIEAALEVMRRYKISGVPVTNNRKLVGILTNRDLRFVSRTDIPIRDVMTKENLITVPVGTTLEDAEHILHQHRVEKLLVVNDAFELKGLITVKDIQKKLKFPNASKDAQGRLRVAGAIGATGDFLERAAALVEENVDALAIDSAHGHSSRVLEAVRECKKRFPDVDLLAGNIATYDGCLALIDAGADAIKVGIGPGFHLHHAHGDWRRHAADHRDQRSVSRGEGPRHLGHCGRRYQIFRRRDKGHRSRCQRHHDRLAVRGRGRIAGRDHPVPGPLIQDLSRHGIALCDGTGFRRTLLPGQGRSVGKRRAEPLTHVT